MSLQLCLSMRSMYAQLILRRPQASQLIVMVQRRMMQRTERLTIRITAQIVQWSVVLLLRRTLRRMMEWWRKIGWLKIGLQRLMVHRWRRSVCTASATTAAASAVTAASAARMSGHITAAISTAAGTSIAAAAAASTTAAAATATAVTTAMRCVCRTTARQADATVTG